VNDIVEFGDVQRGYLGIQYASDLSEEQMKQLGVKEGEGVYVSGVPTDGGAYAAGIKKGDVITKVNNNPVTTGLEMSAQIASFRPNDKVQISYLRGGKETTTTVTLKSKVSQIDVASAGEMIGAELANLDPKKADEIIDQALRQEAGRPLGPSDDIRNETIDGETATAETLTPKGDWESRRFVKEDGKWKLKN